jgi:hypothetical protein
VTPAPPAPAPSDVEPAERGSVVEVNATGEAVRIGAATVVINGNASLVWAAGANVTVNATVEKEVAAAGAVVAIDSTIGKSLWAAGSQVDIKGSVAEDVWTGASQLTIDATVGGNLRGGAASVSVGSGTVINGETYLGGEDVIFDGQTIGEAWLGGDYVVFNGRADAGLNVNAARLSLGPQARITGDLNVSDETILEQDPGATVTGATIRTADDRWWNRMVDPRPGRIGFSVFIAGLTIIVGLFLLLIGRGSVEEMANAFRRRPITGFIAGILVLVFIPILILLFAVTIVGIPLAIAIVFLLPLFFVLSYAVAAIGLADFFLNRSGGKRGVLITLLFLIIGAIALGLISLIPVAGGWIVFILLILGVGTFVRVLLRRLRRPEPVPAM